MQRQSARISVLFFLSASLFAFAPASSAVTLPEEVELDLTLSPAPVGGMVGGQTVIALPPIAGQGDEAAADPAVLIQCSLDNDGGFAGERTSGQVAGSFNYSAISHCDTRMVELDVQAQLQRGGSSVDTTGHGQCYNCVFATAGPKSHSCSSCSGVWRITSTHVLTFPAGFAFIDYDQADAP